MRRETLDFDEEAKAKATRKTNKDKPVLNAFVFNNCLRVNSEALDTAIEKGITIGFYVGPIDTFVEEVLYRLKEKLRPLHVPLYLVDKLPDSLPFTHIYTYSHLYDDEELGSIELMYYEDFYLLKNDKNQPFKIFTHFFDAIKDKIFYKETITRKQRVKEHKVIDKIMKESGAIDASIPIECVGNDPYLRLHSLLERVGAKLKEGSCKNTFLSKYINNGLIDPKHLVLIMKDKNDDIFKRLLHRDYYLNLDWNEIKDISIPFDKASSDKFLDAWKKGETGYPIVDSSMKCLLDTGYLANEYKIIVASFWVKVFHGDWKLGMEHFKLYACGPLNHMKFIKYNYDKIDPIMDKYPVDYHSKII
jgi:hypothetical protein